MELNKSLNLFVKLLKYAKVYREIKTRCDLTEGVFPNSEMLKNGCNNPEVRMQSKLGLGLN